MVINKKAQFFNELVLFFQQKITLAVLMFALDFVLF